MNYDKDAAIDRLSIRLDAETELTDLLKQQLTAAKEENAYLRSCCTHKANVTPLRTCADEMYSALGRLKLVVDSGNSAYCKAGEAIALAKSHYLEIRQAVADDSAFPIVEDKRTALQQAQREIEAIKETIAHRNAEILRQNRLVETKEREIEVLRAVAQEMEDAAIAYLEVSTGLSGSEGAYKTAGAGLAVAFAAFNKLKGSKS
jgi:hypothetical protein